MKSLAEPPPLPIQEPEVLFRGGIQTDRSGIGRDAVISVSLHLLFFVVLGNIQLFGPPRQSLHMPEIRRNVTPLIAPPDLRQLTQKAPQTQEVAKEVNVESLDPKPSIKAPPARASVAPKPAPGVPTPALPEPPPQIQIATNTPAPQLPPPGIGNTNEPPPPQQPPTVDKPKLAFERVPGSGRATGNDAGGQMQPKVNIEMPKSTVTEAVARVAQRPGGGLVVGDDLDAPSLGQILGQKPVPGKMGSTLELLSDPQGADFRSYLQKVLAAVRRNWFSVIPESARLGRTGRVVVQFSIRRDGQVPKLIIAIPSGADPLDRAAVAGISASNPFPPLPNEFKGDIVRLQLSFTYNGTPRIR